MFISSGHPDCEDPERLCGDMVDNYYAIKRLIQLYPDRYKES